jgi:hypothetical protein
MLSNNSAATARAFTAVSGRGKNPLTVILPQNFEGVPEVRALREGLVNGVSTRAQTRGLVRLGIARQDSHNVVIPGAAPASWRGNPESIFAVL